MGRVFTLPYCSLHSLIYTQMLKTKWLKSTVEVMVQKIIFTVVHNQKKKSKACTQKTAFLFSLCRRVDVHKLQRHCYMGNGKCCGHMWCQFLKGACVPVTCFCIIYNLLFLTSVTLRISLEEAQIGATSADDFLQPTWAATSSRTETKTLAQDWESNPNSTFY